ncbi:MFS transporter [Streptomyces sp. 7-21]|uniref:MFS transporter n=1 Tax=Streptomyces sp. 7-21 TaxID=2802283 RepID=UPI00191DD2A8|nr:MFS transporter [Streptomyces sp. 7-21]MBL1067798.1 MFS transporter [Streptomyces sp. 7-21]
MTTTTLAPAAARGADRPAARRRPGWLLAVVLAAQFMAMLDLFIVNVAAPSMRADLGASGGGLQLVVAGYTISYAVLLVTGARLGGRHGPGRVFLAGLAGFTAASLACGVAGGAGQLIAFRFVQGAGAALMLPQVLSLIQRTLSGTARVRALTAFAAVAATGAVAGQVAGGALVSADLFGWGWRPVFLVNVPIGLTLVLLGVRVLPLGGTGAAERARPLDLPGLVLLSATALAFTVPLVLGQEEGWPAWCWASLGASAVLLGAFAWYESRLARRGGAPLLSPLVLRAPGMPLAAFLLCVVTGLNGGNLFVFSLHLQGSEAQSGLGYGALRTGLTFLPTAVAFGGASLLWRSLPARWHGLLPPVGLAMASAALLGAGLLLWDGSGVGVLELVCFGVQGAGLGLAYSPTLAGALSLVRPEYAADASGVTGTMTQLGPLLGTATFGTLFLDRARSSGSTAQAVGVSMTALAAAALLGAVAAVLARRRAR